MRPLIRNSNLFRHCAVGKKETGPDPFSGSAPNDKQDLGQIWPKYSRITGPTRFYTLTVSTYVDHRSLHPIFNTIPSVCQLSCPVTFFQFWAPFPDIDGSSLAGWFERWIFRTIDNFFGAFPETPLNVNVHSLHSRRT